MAPFENLEVPLPPPRAELRHGAFIKMGYGEDQTSYGSMLSFNLD